MRNFETFAKEFADEIDGRYQEYDNDNIIIIVPLKDDRFQAVIGKHTIHNKTQRHVINIKSNICACTENIPYYEVLQSNSEYPYARFVIEDEMLKVEATEFEDHIDEPQIKEMILEVANLADEWEYKITGSDVQ